MQNSLRQSFITLILIVSALIGATGTSFGEETLYLSGRVKDAITNKDLTDAFVLLYDSIGNVRDSIQCNRGSRYIDGERTPMSYYSIMVERKDSTYVFDIVCDGFDLLHQLSNVNYAVTATGRTVSYSNALPRYFLLSAQYRLNIQPKQKKKK